MMQHKDPIRIWHVATHNTNIGDGALVLGIQRTVQEDWDRPVEFINDSLMEYSNYWGNKQYDQKLVDEINKSCDVLFIGGGGMLDGARGNNHLGIGFNMPYDLLLQIKVPIVFYAVGYNLFNHHIYWHASKLKRLIQYATHNPKIVFSVRNDGSWGRLKETFGHLVTSIQEIPDPGMYTLITDMAHPELLETKENIIIQIAGDNPHSRFSGGLWSHLPIIGRVILDRKQSLQLKVLGDALYRLAKRRDINYVLCPHLVRDYTVLGRFVNLLDRGFSRFYFNATGVQRGTQGASTFFDIYKKASLIVGMRGHSVICGVGLGTPTIALSSHKKVRGFMEQVGLSDRIVDFTDLNALQDLDLLIEEVLDNHSSEKERLEIIYRENRSRTRKFNQHLLRLLQT